MNKYDFFKACKRGNLTEIQYYLAAGINIEECTSLGTTGLMFVASGEHIEILKFLLQKGANPNKVDSDHWTALYSTVRTKSFKSAKVLLENGADPKIRCIKGKSPLDLAIEHECWSHVFLLLKHATLLDEKDKESLKKRKFKVKFQKEAMF